MAKAVKYSAVAMELKKEYLKEHLDKVKKLIEDWIQELHASTPLNPNKGIWGWESVYIPALEQDKDDNHMLRQHLRSRSLWSHHASWELKLESIWHLINQVKEEAKRMHAEQSLKEHRQYTEDYVNTALWRGFETACGRVLMIDYKVPENQPGLSFGAYAIEISAATADVRDLIEKEHRDFSYEISRISKMKNLVSMWNDISEVQEAMRALAMKDLKSSNILYPCRFCRHLWK